MKKLLIILSSFFFLNTYANRDAVSTLEYGAKFKSPFSVNVWVYNDACWTFKTYSWDIFNILNTSWDCIKNWSWFECVFQTWNSQNRANNIEKKLYLTWNLWQILSKLWVEQKISTKYTSLRYIHNINADFNLLTNSSWNNNWKLNEYKLNDWDIKLFNNSNTIRYYDNTECKDKHTDYETIETKNDDWTITTTKKPLPFVPKVDIVPKVWNEPVVVDYKNNKIPPEISNDIKIQWCNDKLWIIYCMSDYNNKNLEFIITKLWTYDKINYINFNINNDLNTQNVIRNSRKGSFSIWKNILSVELPKLSWNYTIELSWYWKQWEWSSLSNLVTKKLVIIPNNNFKYSNLILEWWALNWVNKIADNNEYYQYCFTITDDNNNKLLLLDRWLKVIAKNPYKVDTINNKWNSWLIIKDVNFNVNSSIWCFKLSSLVPFTWDLNFWILVQKHNEFMNDVIESYNNLWDIILKNITFLKPFVWLLQASKNGIDYNINPEIWIIHKFKISLEKKSSNISTSNIIYQYDEKHIIPTGDKNFILENLIINNKVWIESFFEWRVNYKWNENIIWKKLWIKIANNNGNSPIIISYEIWWEKVSYYLSGKNNANDLTPVELVYDENKNKSFLWVKIIWNISWEWNQEITGQDINISNLNKSEFRTQIRKNAYEFTKNLNNWSLINWVKYFEWWDFILDEINPTYETLVVKNWNLIIKSNIEKPKFWVIVLSDGYDINNWMTNKWNIYIDKNVVKLSWLFYADGWIMSSNSNSLYKNDSIFRSQELSKQLYLNWSILTRNTIWWAILTDKNKYILPWWSTSDNFNLAMIYDINYIRMWNIWWDLNLNNKQDNDEYKDYSFIIKYNSNLAINPPKLFTK